MTALKKLLVLKLILFTISSKANNEQEAIKKALDAGYKQSGLERNIQNIIDKKISKEQQKLLGNVGTVINILVTEKVELKWTF